MRACVFSIDDNYVVPFEVFFFSLEKTKSIPPGTPIYILHTDSLSNRGIVRISNFIEDFEKKVFFIDASSVIPKNLPIKEEDHLTEATFYRLFVSSILPKNVKEIVYLDSDMLALQCSSELFSVPLCHPIAAVDECKPDDCLRLWGPQSGSYFQAGVLILSLEIWRDNDIETSLRNILSAERSRIKVWDQDVLNLAFKDNWQRLEVWFNVCRMKHWWIDNDQIVKYTKIVHYNGPDKPWNSNAAGPLASHWHKTYKDLYGTNLMLKSDFFKRLRRSVEARFRGLLYGSW